MDVSFALITEGITDQVALEAILKGHYKRIDSDMEVICNPVQPIRDATDESRQGGFAGWEMVFEACSKTEVAAEALAWNDYLIVQIDTDMGDHANFGLPLAPDGEVVEETVLVARTRALIAEKFGEAWPSVENRVFTAVSVHSLECWLLALHATTDACSTNNCENRLSHLLARQNVPYEKVFRCYQDITKDFRKWRRLEQACQRRPSLDLFVKSLPIVQQT